MQGYRPPNRCRCDDCKAANTRNHRAYLDRVAAGEEIFAPAGPVRARVRYLRRLTGASDVVIAKAAGVHPSSISRMFQKVGKPPRYRERVSGELARRIRAVTPSMVGESRFVPPDKTAEQLRELMRLVPLDQIAAEIWVGRGTLEHALYKRRNVLRSTAEAVDRYYHKKMRR